MTQTGLPSGTHSKLHLYRRRMIAPVTRARAPELRRLRREHLVPSSLAIASCAVSAPGLYREARVAYDVISSRSPTSYAGDRIRASRSWCRRISRTQYPFTTPEIPSASSIAWIRRTVAAREGGLARKVIDGSQVRESGKVDCVMRAFQTTRRLWRWAKGRDAFCFEDLELPHVVLGSEYGSHCVYPGSLGEGAVVYSFGVGEDASFDIALIEKFGVHVHAFDPTPRSIEWVKAQALPATFHFAPLGIADFDGAGLFHPPTNPAHVSHSMLPRATATGAPVEVEFRTLKSLMSSLGHTRVNVLKLDVEGSEYAVLDQLLDQAITVDQILVEYHHQFRDISPRRTKASVERLRRAGYHVFYISPTGREFSLIHQRSLLQKT